MPVIALFCRTAMAKASAASASASKILTKYLHICSENCKVISFYIPIAVNKDSAIVFILTYTTKYALVVLCFQLRDDSQS